MARERMVTRTVIGTEVTVMCLNVETRESFNTIVILPAVYKEPKKMLSAVHKRIDNETVSAIKIVSTQIINKCYGMEESVFISTAKELDQETRKPLETAKQEQPKEAK